MATKKITDAEFDSTVNGSGTVLVDFWAEWCGPCRALGPKLEELSDEMSGKATIAKINIDENPDMAAKFGVRSIPMMLIFKDGNVVDQIVGNVDKQTITDKLSAQL